VGEPPRVVVRVFPGGNPGLQISFGWPVQPTYPALPGTKLDDLVFQVNASGCGGGSGNWTAASNLGVSYTDADLGGLNRSRVAIYMLNGSTWQKVPSSVPDPTGKNYVSATINGPGLYAVIQEP
jgi:hypothetical protein